MAAATFNRAGDTATVYLVPPAGTTQVRHVTINIEYPVPPAQPVRAASPSLCSRMVSGLFNHSGKIALIASGLIIASQTEKGANFLADLGKQATDLALENYEPVKKAVLETANEAIKFGKDNLPDINAALSLIWAVPNAFRAGSKKMKAFWLLAGAASAAAPYALKPGFTLQGALDSATKLGTSALAYLQGTNPFKTEL